MTDLRADREQVARFVAALFKHAAGAGFVSLRAFFDKGESRDGLAFAAEAVRVDETLIDRAAAYATRCAGHALRVVFCSPIATFKSPASASAENLAAAFTLSVECDARPQAAVADLSAIIGPPTLLVASGGLWTDPGTGEMVDKLHAHWRLREPATTAEQHAAAKLARSLACAIAGGDPTSNALVHPIRWPGSWHRKAEPRLARIAAETKSEVDLNDALAKLTRVALDRGLARYGDNAASSEKTADVETVVMWLRGIPNCQHDWHFWNRVGMALWAATGGSAEGLELFHRWSSRSPKYDRRTTTQRWRHYFRSPPTRLGAGTLCYLFNEHWVEPDLDGEPT